MKKLGNLISVTLMIIMMFCGLLIAVVSLIIPDQEKSVWENRSLQQYRNPDLKSFFDGTWMQEYESYSLQQIVNRNKIISNYFGILDVFGVKERNDFVVGKENYILGVNEDIPYGRDEYEKKYQRWGDNFVETMVKLNKIVDTSGGQMIILQIPHKNEFCAEYYPIFYEDANEANRVKECILIDKLNSKNLTVVETEDILNENSNEYLYFKTDNHYTFRGAYYVYRHLISFLNEKYGETFYWPEWDKCEYFISEGRSIGNYLKKFGDSGKDYGDYLEYVLPEDMPEYERYENGEFVLTPIISKSTNDYTAFLGDCANTVIDTGRDQLPNILFVGLSYTNALEIMSIYNFNEMHSIDPRHYEGNLSEYIRNHDFDYVIVVRNDLTENNTNFKCTIFDEGEG